MENTILKLDNIVLNKQLSNKYDAIVSAGNLLYENGYVEEEYIRTMVEREHVISTFIGNKIAIPHGVDGSEVFIKKSGITILQVPKGVSFGNGKEAFLIIGIAGKNDEHMDILMNISLICCELENVEKLIKAKTKEEILEVFKLRSDTEIFMNE